MKSVSQLDICICKQCDSVIQLALLISLLFLLGYRLWRILLGYMKSTRIVWESLEGSRIDRSAQNNDNLRSNAGTLSHMQILKLALTRTNTDVKCSKPEIKCLVPQKQNHIKRFLWTLHLFTHSAERNSPRRKSPTSPQAKQAIKVGDGRLAEIRYRWFEGYSWAG